MALGCSTSGSSLLLSLSLSASNGDAHENDDERSSSISSSSISFERMVSRSSTSFLRVCRRSAFFFRNWALSTQSKSKIRSRQRHCATETDESIQWRLYEAGILRVALAKIPAKSQRAVGCCNKSYKNKQSRPKNNVELVVAVLPLLLRDVLGSHV